MKEKSFLEQYYEENLAIFKSKTVQELIDAFNRQVGNKGWTGTRGAYGAALRKALDESGIHWMKQFLPPISLLIGERSYWIKERSCRLIRLPHYCWQTISANNKHLAINVRRSLSLFYIYLH